MGPLDFWRITCWILLLPAILHQSEGAIPRVLTTPSPDDVTTSNRFKEAQEELSKYLEEKIQQVKLRLHEHFEMHRLRNKRSIPTVLALPGHNALQEQHIRVGGVQGDISPSISQFNATCWASVPVGDGELVILGTDSGDLRLLGFNNTGFSLISSHKVPNIPYEAEFFSYARRLWLVVLYGNLYELEHVIAVYIIDQGLFYRRQLITLDGLSSLSLVVSKGKVYMAVSTYNRRSNVGTSRRARVRLYLWKHTQFDVIAGQETSGARSVAAWDMKGTLYVAIAQEQDDSGDYMVGSPVFVHNIREDEKLTYIQIIRTIWPTKILHFAVEGSNYLIFAGKYEARIFWWSGEQFLEWQILEGTHGAIDIQVMYLANGEAMIAVAFKTRVRFYTEDNTSKYIVTFELGIEQYAAEITSLRFVYQLGKYNYAMLTYRATGPNVPANVYKMNLETYETTTRPRWDPLVACLVDLNDTMTVRESALDYFKDRIDKVWVDNRIQEVTADVIVHGTVRAGPSHIENLVIVTNNTNIPQITHTALREGILTADSVLQALSLDVKGVVYRSTDQVVHGMLRFAHPVSASHVTINSLNNDAILNNIPFSALASSTLSIFGDQTITGNFQFGGIHTHTLVVSGTTNGVHLDDLLLVEGDQIIRGQYHMSDITILQNLILSENATVNGVSPSNWVTKRDHQIIDGQKTFSKLNVIRNIEVRSLTNGLDLSELASRAMLLDVDQLIVGELSFVGPLHVFGDIHLKGYINEALNLSFLILNTVDMLNEESIIGRKILTAPVFVRQNLIVNDRVNGIDLSNEIVTLAKEQLISGSWLFTAPIHFMKFISTDLVNGIDLSEEVVYKSGDQTITGLKVFANQIEVETDVVMVPGTTVNGIIISELPNIFVPKHDVVLIGETTFENILVKGDIEAFAGINGFVIKDLEDLLWRKNVPQTIRHPVNFLGGWDVIHDLEVSTTVNGADLANDFVHTFGNETIVGVKTFMNEVTSNMSILIADKQTINGIDWSLFSRVMATTANRNVIRGRKIFTSVEVMGDIIVEDTVNGLRLPDDVMLVDSEQTVQGMMTFTAPTIIANIMIVDDIIIETTVNDVDLSAFIEECVLVDQDGRRPIRDKEFRSGLTTNQIESLGYIDGVSIDEMRRRVMTTNTPQELVAQKNFSNTIHFQNKLAVDKLNGLDIVQHTSNVIFRTREEVIRGNKKMKGKVYIKGNLDVAGRINGIDVNHLTRTAMSRSRENLVLAPMNFANSINGPLMMEDPALLDGVHFSDLVFLFEESVLEGTVHIENDLSVAGDIEVAGLISGCSLSQLFQDALNLTGIHQVIQGNKVLSSLEVEGNVFVAGLINRIQLDELYSRMVTKSTNETVFAPVTFEDGFSVRNLILENFINNVNLTYLFHDAVLSSIPQVIGGTKVFGAENGIQVAGDLTVNGNIDTDVINKVNVAELYQTTVTIDGTQVVNGRKIFGNVDVKGNMILNGQLNGVNLDDIILTNTSEVIYGPTALTKPTIIRGNLTLRGPVDGIDLERLIAERITLNEKETFDALLTFTQTIATSGNLMITESVNGILMKAMVTRHSNFPVDGHKTFMKDLIVGSELEVASINGINIPVLSESLVRYNRPEHLAGMTVFENHVRVDSDILINGMVNNLEVSETKDYFDEQVNQIHEVMMFFIRNIIDQERRLDNQFSAHHHLILTFHYFELTQELSLGPTKKILSSPTYSYFRNVHKGMPTDTLVIWGSKTTYCYGCGCCEEYNTFVMSVEDDGTVRKSSGPHGKRFFPFVFGGQLALSHNGGFLLWTNSTSMKKRCVEPHREDIQITSINGEMDYDYPDQNFVTYQKSNGPFLSSAKVFVAGEDLYMLMTFSYDKKTGSHHTNSTVLKYEADTGRWRDYQLLETYEAVDSDVIAISRGRGEEPEVYLVVANRMKVKGVAMPSIIYKWQVERKNFVLFKRIPTNFVTSVLWVDTGSDLFLLFANEKTGLYDSDVYSNQYTEPLNVYKTTADDFEWYQSVNIPGISALESFMLSGETYVLAASNHMDMVYVLKWQGVNGFDVIQEIPAPGVQDIYGYWSRNGDFYVAIASSTGNTKILKAVLEGPGSFSKITGNPPYGEPDAILQTMHIKAPSSYISDFPFHDEV